MIRNLIVPYNAPLSKLDMETQTFGCRHTNPEICANNSLPNICAFASSDEICKRPSRKWKTQYALLTQENSDVE